VGGRNSSSREGERERKKRGRSRSLEVAVSISARRQTEARICHNTTQELSSAISCSERNKQRNPLSWELLNLACCNNKSTAPGEGRGSKERGSVCLIQE
jgi:hypothetical protein